MVTSGIGHRIAGASHVWTVRLMLICAIAVGLSGISPASAATPQIDLPDMVVRPVDVQAIGYPDVGLSNGILAAKPADLADFVGFYRTDTDVATFASGLNDTDATSAYMLMLGSEQDPSHGLDVRVNSYILAFPNRTTARQGFAALSPALLTDGMKTATLDTSVGTRSALVTGATTDRDHHRYRRTEVLFQVNQFVAGVSVETYGSETPVDPTQVATLAATQLARIKTGLAGNLPAISPHVVRLAVNGRNSVYDDYSVRNGTPYLFTGETDTQFTQDQEAVANYQIMNAYSSQQVILGNPKEIAGVGNPTAYFDDTVVAYPDAATAAKAVQRKASNLQADDVGNLVEVTNLPSLGDTARAFTYTYPDANNVPFNTYRIYVQQGSIFVSMAVITTQPISKTALNRLVSTQWACLDSKSSCATPLPIPAGLAGSSSSDHPRH